MADKPPEFHPFNVKHLPQSIKIRLVPKNVKIPFESPLKPVKASKSVSEDLMANCSKPIKYDSYSPSTNIHTPKITIKTPHKLNLSSQISSFLSTWACQTSKISTPKHDKSEF